MYIIVRCLFMNFKHVRLCYVQNDVNTLLSWVSHQCLTLNLAICKVLVVSNKKIPNSINTHWSITY